MDQVVCKAGHKSGIRCDHKRNAGAGVVICAIQATPDICREAESPKEHLKSKMAILKITSKDLEA